METSQKTGERSSTTRGDTLLTGIGNDTIYIFNTLTWDAEGDDKKIDKILEEFEEHCELRKQFSFKKRCIQVLFKSAGKW